MKIADLKSKKLPELKEVARAMGLSGYSHLRKQDLIYLILETQAETAAGGGNGASRKPSERPREHAEAAASTKAEAKPKAAVSTPAKEAPQLRKPPS